MERKIIKLPSASGKISLTAVSGHFATNHSHVNYYIDMTEIKTNHRTALESAKLLARRVFRDHRGQRHCLLGQHADDWRLSGA